MTLGKRVFIVHGWDDSPDKHWLPWLKKELEKRGFEVIAPQMPNPAVPRIEAWVEHLREVVGKPDKNTYFVGHSIACQTIMRYLQAIDKKIGGVIFVAGFIHLKGLETEDEWKMAKPWLETPINFPRIRKVADNVVAIFSDNDKFVYVEDSEIFRKELNAKVLIEHDKGHFTKRDGVTEIHAVLNELLGMAK
jgi:uncharacterized protein